MLHGHDGRCRTGSRPTALRSLLPPGIRACVWWPAFRRCGRHTQGHHGNVNAVTFLSDGTLASAGYDAAIILWPPGMTLRRCEYPCRGHSTPRDDAGDRPACSRRRRTLRQLDRSGAIVAEVRVSSRPLIALAATADEKLHRRLGHQGGHRVARLPHPEAGSHPRQCRRCAGVGPCLSTPCPDAAGRGADNIISEWDVETGRRLGTSAAIPGRSHERICRQSGRRSLPCLHRLPYARPGGRQSRRTRRCTASSAAGSRRLPAIPTPPLSGGWISSGRRKRCRSSSNWGQAYIRQGPRCRSRRSTIPRIVQR